VTTVSLSGYLKVVVYAQDRLKAEARLEQQKKLFERSRREAGELGNRLRDSLHAQRETQRDLEAITLEHNR